MSHVTVGDSLVDFPVNIKQRCHFTFSSSNSILTALRTSLPPGPKANAMFFCYGGTSLLGISFSFWFFSLCNKAQQNLAAKITIHDFL